MESSDYIQGHLIYRWLLRVRPAELADLLKRILRIRRRPVKIPCGITLFLDPVTRFAQLACQAGGYEPQMSALVKNLVRPGDTFVDVGANEGYFTVLGSLVAGEGRVFALEPQSRLRPVIEENLRLNGCRSTTVSGLALSDAAGLATLHLHASTNNGSSGFFHRQSRGTGSERVPTTTLDAYFAEHGINRVRMMKVDCEGAEKLVMQGGQKTLRSRCIEIVAWEYHPGFLAQNDMSEMDAYFRECGYVLLTLNGQTIYCLPEFADEVQSASGQTMSAEH